MTMQEQKPMVEHQDAPPDDAPEQDTPPAYTGDTGELASIYEQSGFNAVKELLEFDTKFANIIPKANLTPQRANLMRRIAMKELIDQRGALDRASLMQLEAMISVAIEGERANQIVKILSGMGEAVKGAASNGIERMREWGRKF